ncbi:MAG: DUF364 domain-containing protein [Thermoplasmata archaeon]
MSNDDLGRSNNLAYKVLEYCRYNIASLIRNKDSTDSNANKETLEVNENTTLSTEKSSSVKNFIPSITNFKIDAISIGKSYCAVKTRDYIGLSHTPELAGPFDTLPFFLKEHTGRVFDISEYIESPSLLCRAVGFAALNAVLQILLEEKLTEAGKYLHYDIHAFEYIFKYIERHHIGTAAVFGEFPIHSRLKNYLQKLYAFDIKKREGFEHYSTIANIEADIPLFIITGSAFMNGTLEFLLNSARLKKAYTVVIGPSTPLSPVLLHEGVDAAFGLVVKDSCVLNIVQADGDTRHFKRYCRQACMMKEYNSIL